MDSTAINKPVYDALISAGVSEKKAEAAAKAVLPTIDTVATKSDISRIEAKLNLMIWFLGSGIGVLVLERAAQLL